MPCRSSSHGVYQNVASSPSAFIFLPCRPRKFQFQQDGASVHRSAATKAWIKGKSIREFNEGVWPPQSPDLNVIEHLWPLALQELGSTIFHNRDSLWKALQKAFAKIPPQVVQKLYASIPDRLTAVQLAKGGNTRY